MKILAWNCQGLASARAFRALLDIQKQERPDVFFLSETHLGRAKAENLKRKLGCDHFIIHESDGRSGGLLMMWKKDFDIQSQSVSQYFIDVVIKGDEEWRSTGIYGEPRWEHKHLSWEVMRSLHGNMSLPCLALGDFNEILFHHEKEGGRARSNSQLQAFHTALMDRELADIGYSGDVYTWQRGKIRERLDMGVANTQWNILFPNVELVNGEMVKSDHRPIIVNTTGASGQILQREGTRRFEARWLKEETVDEIVQAAWARVSAMG